MSNRLGGKAAIVGIGATEFSKESGRSEMSLAALENCVDAGHPKQWTDITAGEFLEQRLREIGLKK